MWLNGGFSVMAKRSNLFEFEPMLGPCEDYPIGSVEWAERISNRLQLATESVTRDTAHHLKTCLEQIWGAPEPPWNVWPEGKPFGTPDDYCLAVTGHSWKALLEIVRELADDNDLFSEFTMRVDLAKAQIEHRPQGVRTDTLPDNIRKLSDKGGDGGTSAAYLLRRLAKKNKEILDAYERGEFKSVRAAAKAAGLIKEPTAYVKILKLVPKLTDDERDMLVSDLLQYNIDKAKADQQARLKAHRS